MSHVILGQSAQPIFAADPGDSAGKMGLRSSEAGSDPKNDPSPPRSAEKWRWAVL
jgi:hypothetical protein